MKNFRTLDASIVQYHQIKKLKLKGEVRSQLERAALSVCLNLSEGNARATQADRKRMFNIAYASQQEVKSILMIIDESQLHQKADWIGAMIFKLQQLAL